MHLRQKKINLANGMLIGVGEKSSIRLKCWWITMKTGIFQQAYYVPELDANYKSVLPCGYKSVLNNGLCAVKKNYDVILMDTQYN